MSASTRIQVVIPLHQPLTAGEDAIEHAVEKCYAPLIAALEEREKTRVVLHASGHTLDYFARRQLGIPSLYHEHDPENPKREQRQYELIRRILQGNSAFGIMPTGRGKSLGGLKSQAQFLEGELSKKTSLGVR